MSFPDGIISDSEFILIELPEITKFIGTSQFDEECAKLRKELIKHNEEYTSLPN